MIEIEMQCKICGNKISLLQNEIFICPSQYQQGAICLCGHKNIDKVKSAKENQFMKFADSLTHEQQQIFWNILSSYTREQMYDGMKTYLPTLISKN